MGDCESEAGCEYVRNAMPKTKWFEIANPKMFHYFTERHRKVYEKCNVGPTVIISVHMA